ncbi:MAG: 3-hydroxyacyl-CoA dehydrogenase family protein [Ginsengibacter sp.]
MRIFIQGSEEQKNELLSSLVKNEHFSFSQTLPNEEQIELFDAFIVLDVNPKEIDFYSFKDKPVFINEVILTLLELCTPKNIGRISGWPTFLKRDTWEVSGPITPDMLDVFTILNKNAIVVKDSPGMVAARVISMIINEAYFALNENVSSKDEIDLAMKLGTNYPYGPFEWSEKIGLTHIYNLLLKLSETDERCKPAFIL